MLHPMFQCVNELSCDFLDFVAVLGFMTAAAIVLRVVTRNHTLAATFQVYYYAIIVICAVLLGMHHANIGLQQKLTQIQGQFIALWVL